MLQTCRRWNSTLLVCLLHPRPALCAFVNCNPPATAGVHDHPKVTSVQKRHNTCTAFSDLVLHLPVHLCAPIWIAFELPGSSNRVIKPLSTSTAEQTDMETLPEDKVEKSPPSPHDFVPVKRSASSSPSTLVEPSDPSTRASNKGKYQTFLSQQTLPHEALLLVFQFLHEQDMRLIQPCMRTCRAWRKLILDEPRFWNRLQIDLDYPEVALTRAVRHANRLAISTLSPRLSPSLTYSSNNKQNVRSLMNFSMMHLNKTNASQKGSGGTWKSHIHSVLVSIMEKLHPHLSDLQSLNLQIVGNDQIHLSMLSEVLKLLVTYETSNLSSQDANNSRICNSKVTQIVMPLMHSLPVAGNMLAFFQSAENVIIRGSWPFPSDVMYTPEEPEPPAAVARVMAHAARGHDVAHMCTPEILQRHKKYQEELKRYQIDLANHQTYWKLQDLEWYKFHYPKAFFANDWTYGELINVRTCHFNSLTNMDLFGCAISDDLVLPKSGFPNLRSLSIVRCQWGRGLWHFLAHTPYLLSLEVRSLTWNEQRNAKDLNEEAAASPTSTLADKSRMPCDNSINQTSSQASILEDDDTPPYEGPPSPLELADDSSESNYILNNSTIIILGDSESSINDFDDEGDEDPDAAYVDLVDSRIVWGKDEPAYTYPEELCYPPDIDNGCSWAVISKPIAEDTWQYRAGLRFCHRVYTHYDDQDCIDEDFYSEYDWQELQRSRAYIRRKSDILDGDVDDTDDAGSSPVTDDKFQRNGRKHSHAIDLPEHIDLPHLQTLQQIGGMFPPIWVEAAARFEKTVRHPALNIPSLRQVSLSGNRNLESTRITKPVPAFYATALSYREQNNGSGNPVHLSHNNWYSLLQDFEIGRKPVRNEVSDDMLLAMMSEDEAAYYMKRLHKLHQYRQEWRIRQGLLSKNGRANERAVLALITGATIPRSAPFAATALMAVGPLITSLDLSYTNISPVVFQSMMAYSHQLRHLCLSGITSLRDIDLEKLPQTCPLLVSLDISRCGPHLTPRGAVMLVDQMKQHPRNVNRISRIKVDDPIQVNWPVNRQSNKHHFLSFYDYLDFIGVLVDDEAERWHASLQGLSQFSKIPGKKRQHVA